MPSKANGPGEPGASGLSVPEKSVGTIVQEVDRFLRSVRANIEDWKFSMEDSGDGTRIFVRFQILIEPSDGPDHRTTSGAREQGSEERVDARHAPPAEPARATSGAPDGGAPLDARRKGEVDDRSDPDLALFVEEWRRKRDRRVGGEFHKPGAPLGDTPTETRTRRQRRRAASRNGSATG
jgi:hypothetical protein